MKRDYDVTIYILCFVLFKARQIKHLTRIPIFYFVSLNYFENGITIVRTSRWLGVRISPVTCRHTTVWSRITRVVCGVVLERLAIATANVPCRAATWTWCLRRPAFAIRRFTHAICRVMRQVAMHVVRSVMTHRTVDTIVALRIALSAARYRLNI